MIRQTLLLASASLLAAAPAFAQEAATPASPAPAAEAPQDANARLLALFHQSDEDGLRRNPIGAIFRGDPRYADRLGDYITDAYFDGERNAANGEMAALHAIPRDQLTPINQIAYDVFEWQTQQTLDGLTPEMLAINVVRPINHFTGFHTFYPEFASGAGAAPFRTLADYENNLRRHAEYITLQERSIERMREGMASGVLETKLTIQNVITQLDAMLAQGVDNSEFMRPLQNFPEEISEADRTRLTAEYRAATERLVANTTQLRDFLRDEYLPVARDTVGLNGMRGGDVLYASLVEQFTTLDMTAQQVHDLGLSEVERITRGFDQIRQQTGFTGTLPEFFEFIRTDAQFKPASREALTEMYYAVGREVDQRVGTLFSTLPRSPLEIRPYDPSREQHEAGGSYQQGTPDGSRPGIFYFNAYNLPDRLTTGVTTLYLHEGAPGHHFQISLAQENEALPAFMRFGGNTAYVEGWALYAETLGFEMSLFDDPYQRFGTYNDEMLRAMRLVVDTGIHSLGWTRDQAIDYMLTNSGMTRTEVTAEVERYIAMPGQALAYKVGALTIQRLRRESQTALGDRFDIRAFHEQILGTGALPLAVLERKIYDWVEAQGGTRPTPTSIVPPAEAAAPAAG